MTGRKVWRAGQDARRRRPQRADRPTARTASTIRSRATAGRRRSPRTRASSASSYFNDARRAAGHRPRHRPGAGRHAAGHDDRLRRLAHLDARRLRRARARHRHLRGRARARDADADPARRPRTCASRVDGALPPGVTAKDIVLAIIGKIGTAGGTGHVDRVRRRGDPRALDGRPHDGLQHGDRGGRARRPDRAGRDDLSPTCKAGRTRRRAPPGSRRCGYWQTLHSDAGAHFDTARSRSTRRSCRRS